VTELIAGAMGSAVTAENMKACIRFKLRLEVRDSFQGMEPWATI
jgi:hypothetical protein